MRVPVSWLAEYVDLPDSVSAEHLHAAFVRVGFEEEDVHGYGVTGPVVVGQVLSAEPEPQSNGKTINWCQVDVGEPEPRGIVCGAHNFGPGDKVVVTLPGAVLPGPFPIAARKTYGHVSDGMIASVRELGLGDEHDGILRLADLGLDPEPGTDAVALLGLDDFAVEVNVTPDRGYAFSIRGLAREYGLSTGAAFRDPAGDSALVLSGSFGPDYPVRLDPEAVIDGRPAATGFTARIVRGIDPTRPTPAWMRSRLLLAGIRSISLPVDITNYVMLELGQPTHAYDLAKLTGGITVRLARAGERLTTLDGVDRALDPADLLITDESGPIGLAGVMGGADTEISDGTVDVLVEAAAFDPIQIARTARRHRLPSEASKRFERGVDPTVGPIAAARVVKLLVDLAGGTDEPGGANVGPGAPRPPELRLAVGAVTALTGIAIEEDEVRRILHGIGAALDVDASGALLVTPPTWRPDIVDAPSVIEEVARIAGYDRIPSVLPVAPPGRGLTREQRLRRAVATQLAAAGAVEVLAYPFLTADQQELFAPGEPSMRLANAIDERAALLRRSLLPGLIDIARRNLSRGLTDLAVIELGAVYLPAGDTAYGLDALPLGGARPDADALAALEASVPPQPTHVGGLLLGQSVQRAPGAAARPAGLADALDLVDAVAAAIGTEVEVRTGAHPALHPGRTAELLVAGEVVGIAGELLPLVAADLDLPRTVAVFELDLDRAIALAPALPATAPLSTFPAATQDLSLVVADDVPAGEVRAAVARGAGPLLEHIALVDDYRGQGLAPGTKSLTFALRFRAPDRTLTAGEASEAKLAGVAAAAALGATLRE